MTSRKKSLSPSIHTTFQSDSSDERTPGRSRALPLETALCRARKTLLRRVVKMSLFVATLALTVTLASGRALANCPGRCDCNDDTLVVRCEEGKLDVLPITLNPSIQRLVIKNNNIKTVDTAIQFYQELTFLDLSYNQLVSIPPTNFEAQKKLKELHLDNNKLSAVSNNTFLGLRALAVLNLRRNFLEELSADVFSALPNLEELNLGVNRISRIDAHAFRGLAALRVLYLDDNQLSVVPTASFAPLGSLAELHVGMNGFATLPEDAFAGLGRLSVLDLAGAALANISDGAFRGLVGLRSLDLTDNRLRHVPTSQLAELARLEDLSLKQTDLTVVEADAFKGLVNLRRLDITGASQLERVERAAFAENPNLDTLILASNKKLAVIEDGSLGGLPNLRHLSLRDNAFATLPESLLAWHELRRLELADNPFHCDCRLAWLRERLDQRNFSQVQCASPERLKDRALRTLGPDDLGCVLHPTQQQWLIGACVVAVVAALTALSLVLYHCRKRVHEALKDYKWNKRAMSRKEHEYQKTFSEEDYIVRGVHHPPAHFPVTQLQQHQLQHQLQQHQSVGPGIRPIPVTEL